MKNLLKTVLIVGLIFTVSCSDNDDGGSSSNISDANLSGTIQGESFSASGGKAFDSSFGDEELISINITNEDVSCESFIGDYDLYVSTSVPFEIGTYNDEFTNVVLHSGNEAPFNLLGSTVIIEEITDTTITVKIAAEASFSGEENSVEGTFIVDYCE